METGHDDLFARAIRHMACMREPETPQLIVAYLDESKKLNDAGDNLVFAGGAARDRDWDAFNRVWAYALREKQSGPIKMSHALALSGEFYSWRGRENELHEFLFELALRIQEAPIVKVASIMLAGDFESLPASQREKLKDPQYCGFETCVRGISRSFSESDRFQIACDMHEQYSPKCTELFIKLRNNDADLKRRLVGICFGDDAFIPALQVADMIAYCSRAIEEQNRFGAKVRPIVQRISDLWSSAGEEQSYFVYKAGSGGLGSAERG